MNDSKNSSNGLLVLKLGGMVSDQKLDELTELIRPTADALGVEPMVLPAGVDVELKMGSSALLDRICVALEALVAQGQPPKLSEPQNSPQALNAREGWLSGEGGKSNGLNSRG